MKYQSKLSIGISALALSLAAATVAQVAGHGAGRHNPDANGDGNVSRAEATSAAEARFTQMDANGDGRLTTEDRAAGRANHQSEMFGQVDTDSNGSITRAEWDAHHSQMAAHRAERRGAHGGEGDGAGQRMRRHERGHQGGGGAMAAMAHMADTNNDHAIDRAEFLAAATMRFDRADTNHDSNISTAEHDAHRAQMREHMGRRRGAAAPSTGG